MGIFTRTYKNNNKINVDIDEAIPEYLIGDKVRLSQIFMNLASNSLKFTSNGEVKISAKVIRTESTFSFIRFEVSDNGIGIKENDQDRIFEPKFTTKNSGMGLGLSIIKNIIENYKGSITFESQYGQGTTFTVSLPILNS